MKINNIKLIIFALIIVIARINSKNLGLKENTDKKIKENNKQAAPAGNCPYDEETALEVIKKVVDIVLIKPDALSPDGANWAKAKSLCLGFLDSKRIAFGRSIENFHKFVCTNQGSNFNITTLENTVWAKMGEMVINWGNTQKQCSMALPLNRSLSGADVSKVNSVLSGLTSGFNKMDPSNLPKFITGVVATKRFSHNFGGRTFQNLNEVSRS